jgi:hypothetical protein
MESILELLKMSPVLSIILGFIFAGFLAYLFRDTIALYIKKKYNLLDIEEVSFIIRKAAYEVNLTSEDDKRSRELSENLIEKVKEVLIKEKIIYDNKN